MANNLECLGDFVKALVQPGVQQVPTPMAAPGLPAPPADGPLPTEPPQPAPAAEAVATTVTTAAAAAATEEPEPQKDQDKSEGQEKGLEARKQFWAKFKRPASSQNLEEQPTTGSSDVLMSQRTLILGEQEEGSSPAPPAEPCPAKEPQSISASQDLTPTPAPPVPIQEVDPVEMRFLKMDEAELGHQILKAKHHPWFCSFAISEGVQLEKWGKNKDDVVQELTCFHHWVLDPPAHALTPGLTSSLTPPVKPIVVDDSPPDQPAAPAADAQATVSAPAEAAPVEAEALTTGDEPAVAVAGELQKTDSQPENAMLIRFMRMDDVELMAEVNRAKEHPKFRQFQGCPGVRFWWHRAPR